MKIIQIFPGKVWGGAEQYVLDLGKALTQRGHEVIYVSRNAHAVTSRLQGQIAFVRLSFKPFFDKYTHAELEYLMHDADIIHIHDVRFLKFVVRAKKHSQINIKIILTRHIARGSRILWWNRNMFNEIHTIIFVSELAKKLWLGANTWMDKSKCTAILNSIPYETSAGYGEPIRQKYGISQAEPLLMFTGRVRRSKGCEVIIKALSRLAQYKFHVVFVGICKPKEYANKLKHFAESGNILDRVHFYGFSSNVRSLIQEADIGIAPSIVCEACHLSPMEFMQAGKCVIATNNGAQKEYIQSGHTGLLIFPNNVDEMEQALRLVLESDSLRNNLGQSAKMYFNRYLNYDKFVERVMSIYEYSG